MALGPRHWQVLNRGFTARACMPSPETVTGRGDVHRHHLPALRHHVQQGQHLLLRGGGRRCIRSGRRVHLRCGLLKLLRVGGEEAVEGDGARDSLNSAPPTKIRPRFYFLGVAENPGGSVFFWILLKNSAEKTRGRVQKHRSKKGRFSAKNKKCPKYAQCKTCKMGKLQKNRKKITHFLAILQC